MPDAAAAMPLLAALATEGIAPVDFAFGRPTLEAVLFALTGHGATEDADGDQP